MHIKYEICIIHVLSFLKFKIINKFIFLISLKIFSLV